MKVYQYNKHLIYTGTTEALLDPIENKPLLPGQATFTAPPPYDRKKEFLVYDAPVDHWRVREYIPEGIYYLKSNASKLVIPPRNTELSLAMQSKMQDYTTIKPELPVEEATEIHFVDGAWVYKKVNRDFLLNYQVSALKEECTKRIRSYSGTDISNDQWLFKSQNFQDIKATYLSEQGAINSGVNGVELTYTRQQYDEAAGVISRKDKLRKHYRVIKNLMQNMDISELQEFNPTDEKYWKM